jgi:retinol dehydrogenase-12
MHASRLVLACRSMERGEAAKAAILSETGCAGRTTIVVWQVDLDQFGSIRAFCNRLQSELDRIDGFIANAGVELMKYEQSEDLERSLKINVVATFFMVVSMFPKLQETATKYGVDTRLSVVGSLIHYMAPDDQLDVPEDTEILAALSDAKTADMASRYPLSKLIVHQVFTELVKHLPAPSSSRQVIVNLINPGWCATELGRSKEQAFFEHTCFKLIGRTSEEGSRTLVHAVTAGQETHGQYLSECGVAPQSDYMRSERGGRNGKKLFDEVLDRMQKIDSDVARYLL